MCVFMHMTRNIFEQIVKVAEKALKREKILFTFYKINSILGL